MKHNLYLFDGQKAQTLDDLDQWMDAQRAAGSAEHEAYAQVPWLYRCVQLRANALSVVPRSYRKGETAIEYPLDYQMPRLLWLTEAALCIYGAAYWLKMRNRANVEGYRWLVPTSIKVLTDEDKGLTGFERRPGSTTVIKYKPEDLVYFWQPNLKAEVGPGVSPVSAALTAAHLGEYANLFAEGFFKRGAIPATLLVVEGNPPPQELERLETWWRRMLQGVRHAWETVAVRASVKPQIIGQPVKDLAMPELTSVARQQIAVALGIPQTLIEDAANYATASEHRVEFYENTVAPECELIQSVLNEQVFKSQGQEFAFTIQDLDVMQEDEAKRAASLKALRDAGIPLILAMQILGYDLPEGWDYDRLDAYLEQRNRAVVTQVQPEQPEQPSGQPAPEEPNVAQTEPATEPAKANKAAIIEELRRWKRKSTRKGGPVEFDSGVIPADLAEFLDAALETVGLDAWTFLSAKAISRGQVERRIKTLVGDAFGNSLSAVVAAIMAGVEPDLGMLSAELRAALQPELTKLAYEVGMATMLEVGVSFDPVRMNLAAIDWAANYTFELVSGLTKTTEEVVKSAMHAYLTTPGMTNADLEALLAPAFGPVRAEMIAVTEVTRAYSAATNTYQALLGEMGAKFVRIWNTSADDKVCLLCVPLNGKPESAWKRDYPSGPPAHVNCRCGLSLEYVGNER